MSDYEVGKRETLVWRDDKGLWIQIRTFDADGKLLGRQSALFDNDQARSFMKAARTKADSFTEISYDVAVNPETPLANW